MQIGGREAEREGAGRRGVPGRDQTPSPFVDCPGGGGGFQTVRRKNSV
ncbi:hypothetical protein BBAL3_316 [Brevundimonas sp. BAL3]|nr:hypothetical protein BBAL3_316 [Brevundimonas sp. BAL3]